MKPKNPNLKVINYKDTETLKKFINANARIINRRRTGLSAVQQRELAQSIKRARFMGLLPYVAR